MTVKPLSFTIYLYTTSFINQQNSLWRKHGITNPASFHQDRLPLFHRGERRVGYNSNNDQALDCVRIWLG